MSSYCLGKALRSGSGKRPISLGPEGNIPTPSIGPVSLRSARVETTWGTSMGTLQLSFHGPFLYRFTDKEVEIYAPKCPRHAAGIFTAKKEFPLSGRHRMGHGRRYHI